MAAALATLTWALAGIVVLALIVAGLLVFAIARGTRRVLAQAQREAEERRDRAARLQALRDASSRTRR